MRVLDPRTLLASSFVVLAAAASAAAAPPRDLGRETLAAGDGWASHCAGTTGGSAAAASQVYVVTNRREFVAALNNGVYTNPPSTTPSNAPKILYVDGTIDFNVDEEGQPLACEDYYRGTYTLQKFLDAFGPGIAPSGQLEADRVTSRRAQEERVRMRVGSNTTIVGVDKKPTLKGVWLDIRGTTGVANTRSNIIIRNLNFEDTYDCQPAWAPTDGPTGNWNAEFDSISLRDADHVWIDHNRFEDVETVDSALPVHNGRIFQVHDGLVDITNQSDFVTVSWNEFLNHDKVMLIGSTDNPNSARPDEGRLRVTLHHNLWDGVGQRAPRVRFGQVHVYNNLYRIRKDANYVYSWGVGKDSDIYAQSNFFQVDNDVTADEVMDRLNGTQLHERDNLFDGPADRFLTDLVAAYNAANSEDLLEPVPPTWTPTLFTEIEPARHVLPSVLGHAGPFTW